MKKYKNQLELVLLCSKKALEEVLEERPKAGVKANKNTPDESSLKYRKAIKLIDQLHTFFGQRCAFTFGICRECSYWSTVAHQSIGDQFGDCGISGGKKKETHAFESCDKWASKKEKVSLSGL